MSAFVVKVAHVVHSGGSKFYQIVAIQGKTRSICLTHWGKYPGSIPQPKQGGETGLETYSDAPGGAEQLRTKMREKQKRGYKDWTQKDTPMSGSELKRFVENTFPTDKGATALAIFNDAANAEEEDEQPPKLKPETKREPATPATKVTNREWGTW